MTKKARTPIVEYEDSFAIELPGAGPPQERDSLSDQALVVAYDRHLKSRQRWRLRALVFDRGEWTRSGIRRWWAEHEVHFLAADQLDRPIPEICRSYDSMDPAVPTIVLCHRNTPLRPADGQMAGLKARRQRPARGKGQR